jgi:4-hydroxybenzoate polyprenyltransferase
MDRTNRSQTKDVAPEAFENQHSKRLQSVWESPCDSVERSHIWSRALRTWLFGLPFRLQESLARHFGATARRVRSRFRSIQNFTRAIMVLRLAKRFWLLVRAHQWWHYKIPLALAAAFAFAWMSHIPFSMLLLPAGLLVLASAAAGIWASVINDFMDLDQDRLAGKSTPMMELSPSSRRAVLAGAVLLNAVVAWMLQTYPVTLLLLMANWMTFVVYSVPPFRIKERGALGVIAIALGEHVLLGLLAVSLVLETTGMPLAAVPLPWLLAYLGWSMAFGMRGIIWHQILDIEEDRRAGCKTLGALIGKTKLAHIGEWYVFPFEILCFFLLLLLSRDSIFVILFPIYAFTEWLRCKCWGCNIVIAAPKPNMRFIMTECYQIYFPFSFLCLALQSDRSAIFLTVAFILVFPGAIAKLVREMLIIFRWSVYEPMRVALLNHD